MLGFIYFFAEDMTYFVLIETKLGIDKDLPNTLMLEQKEEKDNNETF